MNNYIAIYTHIKVVITSEITFRYDWAKVAKLFVTNKRTRIFLTPMLFFDDQPNQDLSFWVSTHMMTNKIQSTVFFNNCVIITNYSRCSREICCNFAAVFKSTSGRK